MKDSRSLATTAEDAWSNAVVVKLPLKPDCDVNDIAGAEQVTTTVVCSTCKQDGRPLSPAAVIR